MHDSKFDKICYSYDASSIILKDLSFDIKSGTYISLIGPNGVGKSTIAKLLVGLIKPTSGEISVGGVLLSKENLSSIRSQIGIVFQNPDNQFIASTVEDDIAFGLENKAVPQEEMKVIIDEVSSQVGMKEYLDKMAIGNLIFAFVVMLTISSIKEVNKNVYTDTDGCSYNSLDLIKLGE